MPWLQHYDPLGSLGLSALVASVPVLLLLGLLAFAHVRAHIAALCGLAAALAIAVLLYGMPARSAAAAAVFGAGFGLFPIGWIVLNAVFVYRIAVATGTFAQLERQVAGLSADRRIQALLIAFSFGALIEGCAGFGAPVAICGAMLIGLGFRPLEAAKLALIGNTAPVAFGSVGIPLTTLATVTGLDVQALTAMVGRQLPLFSLVVPFWLVASMSGLRGMREVWPACLVAGLSFALVQFAVSNFHGPWLVDIAASLVSLAAIVLLLRVWRPAGVLSNSAPAVAAARSVRPWLPWLLLSVLVAIWKVQPIEAWLKAHSDWSLAVPGVHECIQKMPVSVRDGAVVAVAGAVPKLEDGIYRFQVFAMTGTALLLAGLLSGLLLGMRPSAVAREWWHTLVRVRLSLLTIAVMLALGYTTRYSGTDTTMGLLFAATGPWFPFFSPLLGWLGVALTGSDTSSNVLFGNLQKVTAEQLGLSPILTCASNSSGGVMGKMIDAQSIVVAQTATGGAADAPSAGTILRAVFWHSLALAALVGVLVWLQARVFAWMIPG
jgi:lactate permease